MSEAKRPARPRGEWAESTRRKQNEYKRVKRMKLAADVDRQTGERFREMCEARGSTVSAEITRLVREEMRREAESLDL